MVTLARRRKTLPKESFTVEIESINHEGRGLAHVDGKTVFVDGAIRGETVECLYTRLFNRYDEARVVRVIDGSPDRVTPQCEHISFCGGCSLQHINNTAQLASKQAILLEQLEHFGQVKPDGILPPITGPNYHYRRKARLGVRYVHKKDRVLVGFRERSGRYLADLQSCPILMSPINNLLGELSDLIGTMTVNQAIPQIEVAIGDNATALVFRHLSPLTDQDTDKLIEFAQIHDLHIYLQADNLASVKRIYPEPSANPNDDLLFYHLDDHDVTLHFHPCDFVQVNAIVNQQMIIRAIELLDLKPTDNVLDLFAGLGNFSLPIAKKVSHVCAVEGVDVMVKRIAYNAEKNGIDNITYANANLTRPLHHHPWFADNFNKVLLDPPRSGATEIIPALIEKRPERIVYVSCNPATLARDANDLVYGGYRLANVGVMDMFVHTVHVEAIAEFVLDDTKA